LWKEVGALFARDGSFVFDGSVKPAQTANGPTAVAGFLRARYGGGHEGIKADSLSTFMIDSPVVNLAADGNSAKARWQAIIFHGQGPGHSNAARIEGGVFVNDYVREKGVWKIRTAHFHREMRRFPLMKTDIFMGWGKSRIVEPVPTGTHAPDAPIPTADVAAPGLAMPAFLGVHPVTGKTVKAAGSAKMVAAKVLTGAIVPGSPARRSSAMAIRSRRTRRRRTGHTDTKYRLALPNLSSSPSV
jgi:hypothetical protein